MMRTLLCGACVVLLANVCVAGSTSQPATGGANWPSFRPTGGGPATSPGDPPVQIDLTRDVRFKVAVLAAGQSSPIVWGDRIFLTGEGQRVMAFDRATGRLLWNTELKAGANLDLPGDEDFKVDLDSTGTAAATAVTDGRFVYAFFGTGVLGCVDMEGKQAWAKRLLVGKPRNSFGLAASPVLYGETIIQVVDLGKEPEDNLSFITAVRCRDGEDVWRKDRPTRSAWATPVLTSQPDGDTLITLATPWAIAYDPKTGAERWRAGELTGDVAACPIICGGLLVALSGDGGDVMGVKLGGKGDVTASHVRWTRTISLPDVASPVCDGKRYYHLSGGGMLLALDPASGDDRGKLDLKARHWASPVIAAGRLYAVSDDGTLSVVSLGAAPEVLATVKLGERVTTTPAILDGRIYVRTAKHLMCIGGK